MPYKLTFQDGSSAYLSHHGTKGMKWGVWNTETAARYAGDGKNHAVAAAGGGGIAEKAEEENNNKEEIRSRPTADFHEWLGDNLNRLGGYAAYGLVKGVEAAYGEEAAWKLTSLILDGQYAYKNATGR